MSVHKDICKRFEATRKGETRRFKAVGFRNEGESPVNGDEMLRRVPGAIGDEEDTNFLEECVDQPWSEDLFPYYLATARRNPANPRIVRCFGRGGSRWGRHWSDLDDGWSGLVLVVCRDDA